MVVSIGSIATAQVRVVLNVLDVAPSFCIIWLIFIKENARWVLFNQFKMGIIGYVFSQINRDYAICQALKRFPHHVLALIIYDICCQWCIHFSQHVSESEFLEF